MNLQIDRRTFTNPDDQLDFKNHGQIDIIKMQDGTAGIHAVLKPGWTWAVDEKPLIGNPDTCPTAHTGYCIGGELVVRMVESNKEQTIRKGDFFEIPPGHDAYVKGSEACELIMFAPPEHTH